MDTLFAPARTHTHTSQIYTYIEYARVRRSLIILSRTIEALKCLYIIYIFIFICERIGDVTRRAEGSLCIKYALTNDDDNYDDAGEKGRASDWEGEKESWRVPVWQVYIHIYTHICAAVDVVSSRDPLHTYTYLFIRGIDDVHGVYICICICVFMEHSYIYTNWSARTFLCYISKHAWYIYIYMYMQSDTLLFDEEETKIREREWERKKDIHRYITNEMRKERYITKLYSDTIVRLENSKKIFFFIQKWQI